MTMVCWTDQNYMLHVTIAHGQGLSVFRAGAAIVTNWLADLLGGQSSSVHHQGNMLLFKLA